MTNICLRPGDLTFHSISICNKLTRNNLHLILSRSLTLLQQNKHLPHQSDFPNQCQNMTKSLPQVMESADQPMRDEVITLETLPNICQYSAIHIMLSISEEEIQQPEVLYQYKIPIMSQ